MFLENTVMSSVCHIYYRMQMVFTSRKITGLSSTFAQIALELIEIISLISVKFVGELTSLSDFNNDGPWNKAEFPQLQHYFCYLG